MQIDAHYAFWSPLIYKKISRNGLINGSLLKQDTTLIWFLPLCYRSRYVDTCTVIVPIHRVNWNIFMTDILHGYWWQPLQPYASINIYWLNFPPYLGRFKSHTLHPRCKGDSEMSMDCPWKLWCITMYTVEGLLRVRYSISQLFPYMAIVNKFGRNEREGEWKQIPLPPKSPHFSVPFWASW